MSAGQGGVESAASERISQAYQSDSAENRASDSPDRRVLEQMELVLEASFSDSDTPSFRTLTDAIKKLEMLQETLKLDAQKDQVGRVLEQLRQASPDDLVTSHLRQSWMASVFNSSPSGRGVQAQLDVTASQFRPKENPFSAKPISNMAASQFRFSKHKDSNHFSQDESEGDIPEKNTFFSKLKKLFFG